MSLAAATPDEFAGHLMSSLIGALDTWAIYVGDKLGLYDAFAEAGTMTQADLEARTGIHGRYAREWLEQQVTSGILTVDDAASDPADRRYTLPEAHRTALTDRASLAYITPFIRLVSAAGIQLPSHLDAFRHGGGVSWEQFGPDMRTGQADMNRPWFMQELGQSWFPAVPELHASLQQGGRVADMGCGEGWSSIGMALAYPEATIHGYDVDAPSIEAARRYAAEAGVADRVRFHLSDGAEAAGSECYEVVTAFECIHDMPDPVSVLRRMHELVADDGVVFVMDEAVGDAFGERNDEVERLMYGLSLFICLPDGLSHEESVGTGTVMRASTLRSYALDAGFSDLEVMPIENELWRFYRLHR
jgi:SAM-dependent methyltransferase